MCRVFENFPLTSVQLKSQNCASICPSVRLLNFFGQTTQVYVVIPHGVVTHHQHQECFKIKNILTKPHSLPVPPKSWSCVQNDQKWVFIKCKLWLCLTQLESPRKGDFKKPPTPPPTHTPPKKMTCLNLLLPHTNQWPRSKNGCLLSVFSTYTNGKLLKRRFRKEF